MANKGKIKCTFPSCFEYFGNVKEMKSHKKHSEQHDYCHICDQDFEDWEAYTAHNALWGGQDLLGNTVEHYEAEKKNGAFWNQKREHGKKYGEGKFHKYGCKFCGEQFKTESGRLRHTNQNHPVDQGIECPGCHESFARAAGLMYHLEKNHCLIIPATRFAGYLQHKEIINRLLEDPLLMEQMSKKDFGGFLEAAKDDDQGGGVSLLNDIAGERDGMLQPLVPEKLEKSAKMPVHQQTWPALGAEKAGNDAPVLLLHMDGLSIKEGKKPVQQAKVVPEAWPLPSDYKKGAPLPTAPPKKQAWVDEDGSAASQTLFKDAKPTPPPPNWELISKAITTRDHKSNLLHHQFWNPAHPDYNPERFYDPLLEKYKCPLPGCEKYFDTSHDNRAHIAAEHAVTAIRCPSCLKLFKTYTALVAHCESPNGRCHIAHTTKFGQAIDEFSGGFLKASVEHREDLDVEKDGYKIAYMKYEATTPHDWDPDQKNVSIGTKW